MKYIKKFENFKYQNDIDNFMNQLNDFILKSFPKNKWIINDEISLYVRKSKRLINGDMYNFLDLASIEIENKGQGILTQITKSIENKYPKLNLYVESILNKRLIGLLERLGFTKKESNEPEDINYYKIKNN